MGGDPCWELGCGLTTSRRKNKNLLPNVTLGLGIELLLRKDIVLVAS
jgi:hypothetical protein